MFTERRDYLMDMIERMVARMAEMLLGKGNKDEQYELERDSERAMDDEFADFHRRLAGFDSETAARLVRPVAKLRAYALLLATQAALASAQGRAGADDQGRRALELLLEARLAGETAASDATALRLLQPLVDLDALAPRYLQAIVAFTPEEEP